MARNASYQSGGAALQDVITHDGVFVVDGRQRIVHWNVSAERILGFRAKDVLGKPCYELIGGRDSRNYRFCRRNCPVMIDARGGRSTPDYDVLCCGPTGEEKWINMSIAIPKASSADLQVIHLFRDVTGRRRTEEFARRAAVALRELLSKENGDLSEDHGETSPTPLIRLSRREMEVLRLLATSVAAVSKQISNRMTLTTSN